MSKELKDWTPRYMRMRAELVLFSVILLFMANFGFKDIDRINLGFVVFPITNIGDQLWFIYPFIVVLWIYLVIAFWARWSFERGQLSNIRELVSDLRPLLESIKQDQVPVMDVKESFIKKTEELNKTINEYKEERHTHFSADGCLKSQEEYIKKVIEASKTSGEELDVHDEMAHRDYLDLLVNDKTMNESIIESFEGTKRVMEITIGELSEHIDKLWSPQSVLDTKFKELNGTLSKIVSEHESSIKGEKFDKNFSGFWLPMIFAILVGCFFIYKQVNDTPASSPTSKVTTQADFIKIEVFGADGKALRVQVIPQRHKK